jgi:hypothetical protein
MFYQSVKDELLEIGCEQSSHDPALFFWKKNGKLCGMVGSHVDDFLHAGTEAFDFHVMDRMRKRFLAGRIEEGNFQYVGYRLIQSEGQIVLDQNEYIDSLESIQIPSARTMQKNAELRDSEHTSLRGLVGRLNWIVQGTRPDLSHEMVDLSTKLRKGQVNDLIRGNKAIVRLKGETAVVVFSNLGETRGWRLLGVFRCRTG